MTARVLDAFAERDHHFLVLERLPGSSLREVRRPHDGPLPTTEVLRLARALCALLGACHDAGLIIRDFTPNNIIAQPDGAVRLIDPEIACPSGQTLPIGVGGFTPGYASPQQMRGETPSFADDSYSLAATLFFVATSRDPLFLRDTPAGRPTSERARVQLAAMCDAGMLPRDLVLAIVAGLSEAPEERWAPATVYAHLEAGADASPGVTVGAERASAGPHMSEPLEDDVVGDAAAVAFESIQRAGVDEIVRSSCAGTQYDPCCVQYGAAGVGLFLLSIFERLDATDRDRVGALARRVALATRSESSRPPGLYFGAAGAAWFLLDAGLTLHDDELLQAASELIGATAPLPGRADITHGASGIGLARLRWYLRGGGDHHLSASATLADDVIAAAEASPMGDVWPQRAGPGDRGSAYYGFAHGNAGIAYFLLSVYRATGERRYLDASVGAAETLVRSHVIRDGGAYWPHGPERPTLWTFWCNGSSGVGTLLVRLYEETGDPRYRALAVQAATAVYRHRWFVPLGQCHGLAGNAEFLLDMHQILGVDEYRGMASDLADVLFAHRAVRHGRNLFADESGVAAAPDYAVGMSGIGAFFHRLRAGGSRLLMVDELAARRPPAAGSSRSTARAADYMVAG